jgi:hypothetical protein
LAGLNSDRGRDYTLFRADVRLVQSLVGWRADETCNNQHQVPDQDGDEVLRLVAEGPRFTNKSTDRDAPGNLSRLEMRARISRKVKGSTG